MSSDPFRDYRPGLTHDFISLLERVSHSVFLTTEVRMLRSPASLHPSDQDVSYRDPVKTRRCSRFPYFVYSLPLGRAKRFPVDREAFPFRRLA